MMPSSTFLRHHRPQQEHYHQRQRQQQEKPQVQPASPENALRASSPYDLYAPDPTVPHYSSSAATQSSSQSSPWPAPTAKPSPQSQLATGDDFTTVANSAIALASAAAFPLHLPENPSLPQPSQSQASAASASASSPLSKGALRALRREQLQASRAPFRQQERLVPRQQVSAAAQAAGVSNDGYSNLLNSNRQPSPTHARGLHLNSRFAVAATAVAVDNRNHKHRHRDQNIRRDRSASPTKKSLVAAPSGHSSLANNRTESPVSVTIPGGYSSIPSHSPERTRYPPRRLFDDAASAYSAISNSSNTSNRRPLLASKNNSSSVVEQLSPADPFSNRYALPDSRSPSPQRGRPLPPPPHSTNSATTAFDGYTDIPIHPPVIMNASNPQLAAVAASESSNRSSHASSNQSSSTSTAGYVSNPSPNDYSYPLASPPSPVYGPNVPLHQDFDMPLPPRLTSSVAGSSSRSPSRSASSLRDPFQDDHYSNYASSRSLDPRLGEVNPALIADDGDDGLTYHRSGHSSMINLHKKRDSITPSVKAATAMGGAVMLNALPGGGGGGASTPTSRRSTAYGNVPGVSASTRVLGGAAAAGFTKSALEEKAAGAGASAGGKTRNRRLWKWFIIVVFGILVVGAIIGGTLGGYLANHSAKGKSKSSSSSGESADDDTSKNGILTKDSDEIKKLLNNKDLHKVFPGMDYTPLNTQYPDCLKNPPSQNNVTRDMAMLSQLTNVIRIYGTDCNQTEMIIQAFDYLDISDTMSIWLGVWQDGNSTTNDRQLSQMWNILNTYGDKPFKGLIIANEILYREEMTETELGTLMSSVRSNLTTKGLSLPVGTSDLGDKWTSSLADKSDVIMSNIHPFFGGVPYDQAANWTYSFFTNHNEDYFKSTASDNIISEIGWPTSGGTNCPTGVTTCDSSDGSEASVDGLNALLSDWVCDALTNGTNYFWFSAFDEPWKEKFNEKGKAWEDQWGLMDVNRNLKSGVTIPDCGGKTVS